jgi:DNA-binding transcriptional LysR family regulator
MSDVNVYALYPKHRLNVPKVKAFLDFIQKVFKQRLIN